MWQIKEHAPEIAKICRKLPEQVVKKYELWKDIVFRHSPDKLREFPGFHGEKLKGNRFGQRSSRLNLQYRVIYLVERRVVTVYVLEITPHKVLRSAMKNYGSKKFVAARPHAKLSVGEVLRMLRDLKGWTQRDLAKRSGIGETNLSLLENGRVEIGKKRAEQLAKAFSVHPAIIMFPEYEAAEIGRAA